MTGPTPLLKKPEQAKKRSALTVFTGRKYGSDTNAIPTDLKELRKVAQVPWCASPHDGRDKYIRTFEEDEIEKLYDLREDPAELTNLALLKKHGARLARCVPRQSPNCGAPSQGSSTICRPRELTSEPKGID